MVVVLTGDVMVGAAAEGAASTGFGEVVTCEGARGLHVNAGSLGGATPSALGSRNLTQNAWNSVIISAHDV